MQLYFIRHGQSENNAHWGDADYEDSPDPALTGLAHEQVAALANHFKNLEELDENVTWDPQNRNGYGITHVYTSLMIRAVGTATPLARALGLPLTAWPEIHEGGGIFSRDMDANKIGLPGKDREYFENEYPDLVLPEWLDERGWWQSRPFEAYEDRQVRAEKVWHELLSRHADQDGRPEHKVAIVSHGGFFMHLFAAALGIQMRRFDEFDHAFWLLKNNCSVTRLDFNEGRVVVGYVNRTDYLSDGLIT